MGLQLHSGRKWKDDSFNETNVKSILSDAKRQADKIKKFKENLNLDLIFRNAIKEYNKWFGE